MDVGSENLCLVIKFDSPLEQGWKLKEGHGQVQFLPCEHSDYGTRIEAEQDFCMEYRVGVLYQKCKAIGFFVRSESDFAFYAKIRVHNQSGEVLPDLMTLYCHPGEGSYPEQHPQYPNECEVHVPVKQLKNGWFLWMIDLPWQTRKAARVKGKEWEFDRLLWLELKGYGVKIDADHIELYEESPWKRQIFLCYAREDEEKVNNLYQKLCDEGFKPWMDKKDILPGEQWEFCIPRAIRRSDFFLACLSANSVTKRGYLQKEIKEGLDIWDEMLEDDIYLIPVRLEDCEVPERLRDFQWVNLFEEDSWTRLVKAIQVGVKRREEIKPNVQESTPFESYPAHEKPSPYQGMTTLKEGSEQVAEHKEVQGPIEEPGPIRIAGVIVDEVKVPSNDGTPGSALYTVPFRLSHRPSAEWARLLIAIWDSPPRFTSMHRPGIARVVGDRIILDGTTMEEVERYHLETLKLVVEETSRKIAQIEKDKRKREAQEEERLERHRDKIKNISNRLKFD